MTELGRFDSKHDISLICKLNSSIMNIMGKLSNSKVYTTLCCLVWQKPNVRQNDRGGLSIFIFIQIFSATIIATYQLAQPQGKTSTRTGVCPQTVAEHTRVFSFSTSKKNYILARFTFLQACSFDVFFLCPDGRSRITHERFDISSTFVTLMCILASTNHVYFQTRYLFANSFTE